MGDTQYFNLPPWKGLLKGQTRFCVPQFVIKSRRDDRRVRCLDIEITGGKELTSSRCSSRRADYPKANCIPACGAHTLQSFYVRIHQFDERITYISSLNENFARLRWEDISINMSAGDFFLAVSIQPDHLAGTEPNNCSSDFGLTEMRVPIRIEQ